MPAVCYKPTLSAGLRIVRFAPFDNEVVAFRLTADGFVDRRIQQHVFFASA